MARENVLRTGLGGVPECVESNGHTSIRTYQADSANEDPLAWVHRHKDELKAVLETQGACLLRGFPAEVEVFQEVVSVLGGEPLEYTERSTPRSAVGGNVYTSTEYPPDQPIPMHNESSYSRRWPRRLFFFCHTPPGSGGATPLADSRAVHRMISPETRERFASGVLYTRTFREGIGLSWQDAFQTDDRAEVEAYCAANGQEFEWTAEGLRTRHRRPAYVTEPVTGQDVWFNQANLFHVSAVDPEVREVLLEMYAEEDLPRNAYHGDGGAISDAVLAEIGRVYTTAALAVPWRRGDVMAVNNMLMAHGRQPFSGERRILVAMT
ncbi:TauD/TfdA family dioxygenase [Actinomadura chibensis]|uniref:TauD/TfdA family dioxygenase n=1 Tax=Actinomadura chibensis TaxID=392828 RepID=A0A5D0NEM3_9ACTN|nr:TauD/TfdA family dioxygenase [Actinomadura chibensis]TYB42783.1 TauD/TfdA family dioxygenase [Actinomadura chibensis]